MGHHFIMGLFGEVANEGGANTTTDKAGEFKLELPQPGRYVVCIGHEKFGWTLRTNQDVPALRDEVSSYTLEPPAMVNGEFPIPLPNYRVQSLRAHLIWPGNDGINHSKVYCATFVTSPQMQVGPLPAHFRYRIAWECFAADKNRNDRVTLKSFAVDAKPGVSIDLNFAHVDPGKIVGRLTDRENKPLRDVTVHLNFDAADDTSIGTFTDQDGRFVLAGPPAGKHRLAFLRHEPVPG